jgi:thiol-disulfide isomerase/thioredoxin
MRFMIQRNINYMHIILNFNLLLIALFYLSSCEERLKFDKQIQTYLLNEYDINVKNHKNLILIFLKNGSCSDCEEETIKLIERLSEDTKYKIIVHYRKKDASLERLKVLPVEIIVSQGNIMDSYGLILDKDLLVNYKSDKIDFFGWLFKDELVKVTKHFIDINKYQ